MRCFILPKHYYNRFHNIDFAKLFADIDNIGFKVLNGYGISSYDMFLILYLNINLGHFTGLYNRFLEYYKGKRFDVYTFKDWLECETEDDIGKGLCDFKACNKDILLIIAKYDLFKLLETSGSDKELVDQTIDYIYSNFGEEVVLNSDSFYSKMLEV